MSTKNLVNVGMVTQPNSAALSPEFSEQGPFLVLADFELQSRYCSLKDDPRPARPKVLPLGAF